MMNMLRKLLKGSTAAVMLAAAAIIILPAAILVGLLDLICRLILLVT